MKYSLLSVDRDAKTKKGTLAGWLTAVLFLSPAKEADGVHDMCPGRCPECTEGCLYNSGFAEAYPMVNEGRIARTLDYIANPKRFMARLERDTDKFLIEAKTRNLKPAARWNGTSDQWKLANHMIKRYPGLQQYDYTKLDRPWERVRDNYHLTYSFKGDNLRQCMNALEHNINVAVIFKGAKPGRWHGVPVIDGDRNDLRFLDPKGVIVGLRPKGRRIQQLKPGGFVQIGVVAA